MHLEFEHQRIYRAHAAEYDRLVSADDHPGNLIQAIGEIAPLAGARVLEVGAGTGRITRQLLEHGAIVTATEISPAMVEVARERLAGFPRDRWTLDVADARALPTPDGWADLAVAGWVLGHFREWHAPRWREAVSEALAEMERSLRVGGQLVVVETLGTGHETPRAPTEELGEYFRWLEEQGFTRRWVRTDYHFADAEEGEDVLRLFFGAAMADAFRAGAGHRLPECTGIWWKRRG